MKKNKPLSQTRYADVCRAMVREKKVSINRIVCHLRTTESMARATFARMYKDGIIKRVNSRRFDVVVNLRQMNAILTTKAMPKTAMPKTAMPKTAMPKTAMPKTATAVEPTMSPMRRKTREVKAITITTSASGKVERAAALNDINALSTVTGIPVAKFMDAALARFLRHPPVKKAVRRAKLSLESRAAIKELSTLMSENVNEALKAARTIVPLK